jgi:hypothetical protein
MSGSDSPNSSKITSVSLSAAQDSANSVLADHLFKGLVCPVVRRQRRDGRWYELFVARTYAGGRSYNTKYTRRQKNVSKRIRKAGSLCLAIQKHESAQTEAPSLLVDNSDLHN